GDAAEEGVVVGETHGPDLIGRRRRRIERGRAADGRCIAASGAGPRGVLFRLPFCTPHPATQEHRMAIDFRFPEEIELVRTKVREFCDQVVRPAEKEIEAHEGDRKVLVEQVIRMRKAAKEWGLWLPHMPEEWGGMGLGHVAMAAVSAEAAKTRFGPFALNAQAPDEGNMHTLLHWGTPEQKEKYLRPLCEGRVRSCFAMTEPE